MGRGAHRAPPGARMILNNLILFQLSRVSRLSPPSPRQGKPWRGNSSGGESPGHSDDDPRGGTPGHDTYHVRADDVERGPAGWKITTKESIFCRTFACAAADDSSLSYACPSTSSLPQNPPHLIATCCAGRREPWENCLLHLSRFRGCL